MTTAAPMPETGYADSDGLSIAYQVFGAGEQDLVVVPGIISHLEMNWQYDAYARMLHRFAQRFRVIVFDKRGQGLSDGFDGVPTLEQRMDDVRAVMQAAGSRRASLFASSEGGAMAALFAATHPGLVHKLVLYAAMARFTGTADYPHSPTLEQHLHAVAESWGKAFSVRGFAPSRARDEDFGQLIARYQRQCASPGAIKRMIMANDQIDVRPILPQIRRPTLILQRRSDRIVVRGNGRYLADHVPQAVYLELPGDDHFAPEGDAQTLIDAICRFVADEDSTHAAGHTAGHTEQRWLSTVLFTDIVGSTEIATRLGDRAWGELLQRFHAVGRRQLAAHRGHEVDTAGDGLFAIFDGPARAVQCALAIGQEAGALGIDMRAGLHTGEVEASGEKVAGIAVHIGARVMAQAAAGEVLVSSTVRDLVAGSGLEFEARGMHALKGVPGEWSLHRALLA